MSGSRFQTKIFIHYILVELVLLTVLFALFFGLVKPSLTTNAYKDINKLSTEADESIDQFLDKNIKDVKSISDNPIIRSPTFSKGEKLDILNIFQGVLGIYDEISLLDVNGNVVVSTAVNPKENWANDRDFFTALDGEFVASNAQKRTETKIVLWFLSPVVENKQVVGVVAAQMPISALWKLTDKKIGEAGFALILDDNGKVIAHPDKSVILKDNPYNFDSATLFSGDVITVKNSDGSNLVVGYSKLLKSDYERNEWFIFVAQPENDAFATLNSISNNFMFMLAISFVIATIANFWMSKNLTKPLDTLSSGVKRILAGDWNYELNIKSDDDVEELSNSFKDITKMIKEKELLERLKSDLQKRVEEAEKLNKILVGREAKIAQLKREVDQLKEKLNKR